MSDPTPHVFVSYASVDHAVVAPLIAALERAGVRIWLDRTGIPGGVNYRPEIVAAIKASAGVVLCFRPRLSSHATYVRRWRSPGSMNARSCPCSWSAW